MFTHYKIISESPMARSTCNCDLKDNHPAGQEYFLTRPDWNKMARLIRSAGPAA